MCGVPRCMGWILVLHKYHGPFEEHWPLLVPLLDEGGLHKLAVVFGVHFQSIFHSKWLNQFTVDNTSPYHHPSLTLLAPSTVHMSVFMYCFSHSWRWFSASLSAPIMWSTLWLICVFSSQQVFCAVIRTQRLCHFSCFVSLPMPFPHLAGFFLPHFHSKTPVRCASDGNKCYRMGINHTERNLRNICLWQQ